MADNVLPNFMIIGPPKTASTSLHYYLSQHPDICMSEPKETRYMDNQYREDLAGYSKYFAHAKGQKAIGDGTPTYSFLPFVAERIQKHFPAIKLIICFRDPVDRAFSGWLMRCAKGNEKNSFQEALRLNMEQRSKHTLHGDDGIAFWMEDQNALGDKNQILCRTYVEGSMYAEQMEYYLNKFKPEQIHYLFMDDLRKDLIPTLQKMFAFLGVDEKFDQIKTEEVNKHKKVRLKFLFNLFGKDKVKNVKNFLPAPLANLLKPILRTEVKKPEITDADKKFAWDIFKDDVAKLEQIIGKNLTQWRKKYE